jgi:hypothetical protein
MTNGSEEEGLVVVMGKKELRVAIPCMSLKAWCLMNNVGGAVPENS